MNNNSSKSIILSVIGVAVLVVAVVGVSFAFFTYLGGEADNTVSVGTIVFNSTQSGLTLQNQFPRDAADNSSVARVSISGKTTYAAGINYRIVLTEVTKPTGADAILPKVAITSSGAANVTVVPGTTAVKDWANGTILASGNVSAAFNSPTTPVEILTISAYYDKADYHISDSTLAELQSVGLLTGYQGKVVPTATWNALADFTFSFRLIAEEA